MKHDFDWSLARSFLAALDCGSLLGASRMLGTSQPTIGRHIAELEAQLGVDLFERTGRGLLPTDTALRLADAARQMESSALQLARTVSQSQSRIRGTVRLAASQPVACLLLPPILARMRVAQPDIQVELVVSNGVSNLLRREADIALRMVQPDQATLVARRIGKVTLGVYAHRDYLSHHGTPQHPRDLLDHALIGNDRDDAIIRGFAAMGHPVGPEQFVLRTDDLIAYWEAVRAGIGIGFVSDYVARTDDAIVAILPRLKIPAIPMWLAVHREIRTSARIRAVFDHLAAAIPAAL
ncbi:LysR family transcriptional regulator [Comamonadaceae bacterium G21597-S1]|nr:LysR family transcriptional regulator [Comamonadaceae bacterium G21597-S1]